MLLSLLLPVLLTLVPAPSPGPVCDATWHDAARNRDMPVRIRMPAGTGKAPVILFSHGLAGSLDAGTIWAEGWAEAGFIVIHLQHPGSDGPAVRANGVQAAMRGEQLVARARDVRFALDTLGGPQSDGRCDLRRADLDHVGMAGHSYGAHTTLAVSGQRYGPAGSLADARIDAAIAFSPAPPRAENQSDEDAFGAIAIPVFTITGTRDTSPVSDITAEDRQRPFRAMPPGGKYLFVVDGANHAAFGGNRLRAGASEGPSRMQRDIVALTTLFWRWTLMGDAAAKARLDAADSMIGTADRFEKR